MDGKPFSPLHHNPPSLSPSLPPCAVGLNVELEAFQALHPKHAGSDATTSAEIALKKTEVALDAAELEGAPLWV